ncbi:Protein kinase [Coelomomyces lativittatus]|nr:Protein kinase [Coelomomyces lativittatus]
MVLLHNPNIIEVKDVIETDSKIGIVMEYAEKGELFDYIVQKKNLSEREARELFQQILDAIEYCHEHCIIHRDLKPENLLLDKDMKIKLVDFGFGNTFDGYRMLDTFCGSPFYAAPEMIKGIRYSGPDSDIWSLGVILYAMLCGKLPFDAQDLRKLYEKIAVGVFKCPSFLSADAVDLLHTMIRVDPQQRASIDQIKRHPWMQPMALPKQPFVIQIHPPINPVYVDMIVSFGYPKDEVMDRLKGSLSTPPLMTASPYSMTPFTLVQPKKMHPILGYYDLICGSPLVQAKLKPHTSIDSMYSSLLNVEGPRRTKLSFQTWSVTTEFGAGEVMSIVEDVLNQANVVWKFDKNVFSCKKDGKRFDLVWNALSHSVFIRQMHGTVLGTRHFFRSCILLLAFLIYL